MKTLKQFIEESLLLNEKLLLINKGKKYGQIVFLAGGAGSGKGFAGSNFLNSQDYAVRDVDEMKRLFLKISKEKGKYPEIANLDTRNPNDVFRLHKFVENGGFPDKSLNNMISQMRNPEILPNIIFDVTLKDIKKYYSIVDQLLPMGYKPENIHLVWILTDFAVSVKANRERTRVVPDDIMLQTHSGAHETMWDVVGKGNIPENLDGGIYVILNNRENTVLYTGENGKPIKGTGNEKVIIKDFTYLAYKNPGQPPMDNMKIKAQLYQWVQNNVPYIAGPGIWGETEEST